MSNIESSPCVTCEKLQKINDKTRELIGCGLILFCPERKAYIKRLKARTNRHIKALA